MPNRKPPPPKGRRRLFNPPKRAKQKNTGHRNSKKALSDNADKSFKLNYDTEDIVPVPMQLAHTFEMDHDYAAPIAVDVKVNDSFVFPLSPRTESNSALLYPSPTHCNLRSDDFAAVVNVAGINSKGNSPFKPVLDIYQTEMKNLNSPPANMPCGHDNNPRVCQSIEDDPGIDSINVILPDEPPINEPITDVPTVPTDVAELLRFVEDRLKAHLPKHWILMTVSQGFQLGLPACSELLIIQRALFFAADGRVVAGVHGKSLPADHDFWQDILQVPLTPDTTEEFIQNVSRAVRKLRSFEVCKGVESYQHLWKRAPNSRIDCNPFCEQRYKETCRSNSCSLLVPSLIRKRCDACNKLWASLKKQDKARKDCTPNKFKPHSTLHTPEVKKRLEKSSAEIEKIKRSNRSLAEQLEKFKTLTRTEGVYVNKDLSDDLTAIIQSPGAHPLLNYG